MGPVSALRWLRWAVVVANLEPIIGHEQSGARRALVVSYDSFHHALARHLGLDIPTTVDGAAGSDAFGP